MMQFSSSLLNVDFQTVQISSMHFMTGAFRFRVACTILKVQISESEILNLSEIILHTQYYSHAACYNIICYNIFITCYNIFVALAYYLTNVKSHFFNCLLLIRFPFFWSAFRSPLCTSYPSPLLPLASNNRRI